MAATFTSWTALHTAMLNAAADFFANRISVASYTVDTGGSRRQLEYRTVAEFQAGLEFVAHMAATESGSVSLRTVAVPRRV